MRLRSNADITVSPSDASSFLEWPVHVKQLRIIHFIITVLKSTNVFGEKYCELHVGIIDGTVTAYHEYTLGPDRRNRFPENRFVREILACAHKRWRKMYIPYKRRRN